MIVLDASSIVELLRGSAAGARVRATVSAHKGDVHLPHLAFPETGSVLRSLVARQEMDVRQASDAVRDLTRLAGARYPAEPLLVRMWELRHNLSMYDANYVALAERLRAPLLTCDTRIARANGHHAVVEVVPVDG